MNSERPPIDTESTLELILNTLCRAFQMKPKQSAALLTNNNQFLIHSIVKGVKGKYEPLISWYQDLYSNSKHLSTLLELEIEQYPNSSNFQKVLATLSCGLYSHNLEICKWCCKLLTKIGYDFGQNQQLFNQAMSWFLEKEGGLELSLHALKKHSDLAEDFVAFTTQFGSINDQIDQVYKVELKKYFSSPLDYVNAINDLFPFLVSQCTPEVTRSGILDFWIESCVRQADNDGKHSYDERIAALTLLTEIWISFTQFIDQKEELANNVLSMLKRASRDKHKPIRTVAVCQLFRLLDKFSEEKNNSAPSVYKTLIFSLVENPYDSTLRELFFINFISLYEAHQTIPVGLLIEPLIKQIQVTEGVSFFYKIFDFDFFSFIAKHAKLTIQGAIPLADLLAKVYLNEVVYSSAAAVPFIQTCSRFLFDDQMQEFIIKFETICLSMLMGLERNAEDLQYKHQQLLLAREQQLKAGKKPLALPAPPTFAPLTKKNLSGKKLTKEMRIKQLKEQDEDVTRRLKKTHIVEVTMKIQNLRSEDINDQLRDMLLSANKRFNELYGYFNKGIMALLKWWGEPESIMQSYIRAIEEREALEKAERERKEREEQERIRLAQEEKDRREQEERDRRQKEHEDKMRLMIASAEFENATEEERRLMVGYGSADQLYGGEGSPLGSKGQSVRNSMALIPYTGKIVSVKNQRAVQQIEKIKRNKMEKEEQKRLEDERKKSQQEKKSKKLKEQVEKRKLELGIGASQNLDVKALVYKEGAVLSDNDKLRRLAEQKMMIPQISLFDLDEEEDRDKEAVEMFMKKYAKLWKNLYYKYGNSGFSSKPISSFDQLGEKFQLINLPEIIKMLKDYGTFPQLVNKGELHQLVRLINTKLFPGNSNLQAMDFIGFQQFMMQLGFFCFSKPPKDLSHLPPVESLRNLVSQMEKATRSRGNSTLLFEDPDASGMGDQQLIKALNEKLAQDPDYPIPEGYSKQVEKTPLYDYRLSDNMREQVPEEQVIGIELMDELLNEIFGIHFLEPLVSFDERLKVRPIVKNLFKPQAEALNYMRKVEKNLKPVDQTLNPYASLSALEKQKYNQEIKPTLNLALKLEVAQYPLKERPQVQDVAEVLEEILQAAEKGLESLPNRLNRAPGQVWNEVKQKKQEDELKENEQKQHKEEFRKKRDNLVKNEISKVKETKLKDLEENKQQRMEQDRMEKENKQRQQDDMRRRLDDKKKKIEGAKNSKLEEIKQKRLEDEEKNRELEEKKKRERAEYMKKHKQELQVGFKETLKEREELAARQQELDKKEKEYQMRIRSNMENFIKENQQDRVREQEDRKQINEFIKQPDVENVFSLFDKSLKQMYKFYASQDKKDLDFNLERSMNTINFREFIRFGYQQLIVPTLLPPEDMVSIYRQLIRERIEEISGGLYENYLGDNNSAQIFDYEYFKKSLIRIAVMAQDALGGQKEDALLHKLENEYQNNQRNKRQRTQSQQNKSRLEGGDEAQQDGNNGGGQASQSNLKKATGGGESEEVKYEINQSAKEKEDAFFKKWMADREAKGVSLKKRIIGREKDEGKKKVTKKRVKIAGKEGEEDIREGEDFDDAGGASGAEGEQKNKTLGSTLLKKSKAAKALRDLEKSKGAHTDALASMKIEKSHIKKDLDVNIVSAKTIEALLKFLGLESDISRQGLDNRLNKARIEIQGQKPTKFKKQLKPTKLETLKQGGPAPIQEGEEDFQQKQDLEGEGGGD